MKQIFTKFFLLVIFSIASFTLSAQTYNGGTWYSLYDTGENSNVNALSPDFAEKSVFAPAESMTFEYKKFSLLSTDGKVEVYNKVNGTDWSSSKGSVSYSDRKNWKTSPTISLDANISHIRYKMASGTGVYVRNHFVKLKKHILIADGGYGKSSESKSFENVTIGGTSNVQTVNLRSFLTNGDITITSSDSAFRINTVDNLEGVTYAVGANACASSNGQSGAKAGGGTLGDINQYAFDIYFCPSEAKTYNATITITDGTSTATITVSGEGVKKDQSVVWNEAYAGGELTIGQVVVDAASATSGLAVTYHSSDETVVAIINDGAAIQAVGVGVATVTAIVPESAEWNASSAEMLFTVAGKLEQEIVWEQDFSYVNILDTIVLTATAQTDIAYSVSDETIAFIDGTTIIFHQSGEVVVYAYAAENNIYSADTIAKTIVASKLEQTIELEQNYYAINVGDTLLLDGLAQATSGLELNYQLSTEGLAVIEENLLIAQSVGTLVVVVSQTGNELYAPASDVEIEILIQPQVSTNCESITTDQVEVRKVIRNGQIYIFRGDHIFDALGNMIK